MARIWTFLGFILFPLHLYAQGGLDTYAKGARSMGMGNANLSLVDTWSVFNNIGALGRITEPSIVVGYDHRFQLNELTTLSAGTVIVSDRFNFGLSVSSFGDEDFNQRHIGFGISNQMGIASLGVKVNYVQTNIEGFGRSAVPVIEFGGLAELSPNLFFGAHIYNLTNAKVSKLSNDHIPTVVKSGLSYLPTDKLIINLEAEKDILLEPVLKLGLEYNLMEKLWMRTGINTNPSNLFFGLGFRPKSFVIDYAMTQNQYLGATHHFSFGYIFSKK
ncbi:hypothetical protein SAMN06295967_105136 [Belliella buryatensis]|uniref:Type IX secretion system membrane protein, PorP/SprF family n=1 Tax=Belliella buryatensis TaxID=1500549 RepID=A0A239CMT1_9BACT|nr:hypothetical protein [Belliella buryatensis]SNS21457.1 hypothetical protein SAMN06295967_105136 [Belliella buryatensis]